MDLRLGSTVFGKSKNELFEIIDFIDHGAFGLVYKIEDTSGSFFALKTLLTVSLDERKLRAMLNEGDLSTQIEHENVLKVFHFHDGKQFPHLPPYMIMEYADGGTLSHILGKS
jgi:serine/threonine protein kinase